MAEDIRKAYSFRYQLSYEELYEAFYLLAFRWSRKFKLAAGIALIAITVGMLIFFYRDPTKVHLFYIAIIAILLLFYLIYAPALKAGRGARQMAKQGAVFQVRLTEDGKVMLQKGSFSLAGDKNARAYETKDLFVIRADSAQSLCIPKRVMGPGEADGVRSLLAAHIKVLPR